LPYTLEFEIEDLPKTTNSFKRQHWTHKWKEAQKWKALVLIHTQGKIPSYPLKRAKLTLTRCSSSPPDSDGLVSSFKHVIDGLTNADILFDDAFTVIRMPEYKWEKAPPKKGKIKVSVVELELE